MPEEKREEIYFKSPTDVMQKKLQKIDSELIQFQKLDWEDIGDRTLVLIGGRIALLAREVYSIAQNIGIEKDQSISGITPEDVQKLETAYEKKDADVVREFFTKDNKN